MSLQTAHRSKCGTVLCVALGSGSRIKAACGCGRGVPFWRLEPAPDDFSLPCFAGCLNRPVRTRASPLPCSRARQRSPQVCNAGEWWVWKGERTAACEPARSPASAPVTCAPVTKLLSCYYYILLSYYCLINTIILQNYFSITTTLLPFHYYILLHEYFLLLHNYCMITL